MPARLDPDRDPKARAAEQRKRRNVTLGPARKARAKEFLEHRRRGMTIDAATAAMGVTKHWYKQLRKESEWFRNEADRVAAQAKGDYIPPPCPFTPAFREDYLAFDYEIEPINPRHILVMIDFISRIQPGEFALITLPPDHAKTSIGEDWLNASIADDPESRNVIISKNQPEAIKRLLHVQARMEEVDFYPGYIETWGPFKPESRGVRPWAATKMTVQRKTPRHRDYSLQALGIGGQIQGARITRVLCDDPIDDKNYPEFEGQARYIRQSVNTRLGDYGMGLMIGTRQDEMDLYRHLKDEDFFDHVLVLPARFDEDFSYEMRDGTVISWKAGEVLWPERFSDDAYLTFERKAGPRLWALTYQQKDVVSAGQQFPLAMFERNYNPHRRAQEVRLNEISVAGIDLSVANYSAAFGLGVNPQTKLRTWIDVWNEKGLVGDGGDITPGLIQFILNFVAQYKVRVLALEENSTFLLVSTNNFLKSELTSMGCRLLPVTSSAQGLASRVRETKDIEDLSISQLSTVFSNGMHQIPTGENSLSIFNKAIRQFMSWRANNRKIVKDMVKACQFAEAAARNCLNFGDSEPYADDPDGEPLPPYLMEQQVSVPIGG